MPERDGDARWRAAPARVLGRLARHETLLWWLHSAYVLALGVGIMWLGSRNFAWLRYSGFYLLAIAVLSLLLADVVNVRAGVWWGRARLAVNYVNKNLYQQLLFFILPTYAASATFGSRNVVFVVVLAAAAVTSTLDLVYDRVLSVRRGFAATFFAFNVFAVVNLALPVMLGTSTQDSLPIAAAASAAGLVVIACRGRRLVWWLGPVAAAALLVFWAADIVRPFVPPAPLRLETTRFGTSMNRATLLVTEPLPALPEGFAGRIYASTALRAPLGLKERVMLQWSRDGRPLRSSAAYGVSGGRQGGFRLWSSVAIAPSSGRGPLTLEVVTEAGQLVGRATLRPAR